MAPSVKFLKFLMTTLAGFGLGLGAMNLVSQDRIEPVDDRVLGPILDIDSALMREIRIDANLNPHTRSLAEHFQTGRFPERNSVLPIGEPFNAVAYQAALASYLDIVEPGRVWQTLQPAEGTPELALRSPSRVAISQDGSTVLRVQTIPGGPVTFTSFDLGSFDNGLNSITVAADDQGEARALFLGTPATTGVVNILAGSPVASGQIHFVVDVEPKVAPEPVALGRNGN